MSKSARYAANRSNGIVKALDHGMELHRKGRLKEAEASYRKVLGAAPTHVGALRLLAVLSHECGRNEEAEILLRRVVAIDPNFALAHRNLALIVSLLGKDGEAAYHYAEASRLDPTDKDAMIEEARIASDIGGDCERALVLYDRALLIDPKDARLHRGRGKVLAELARFDEAVDAMAEAAKLAPDDAVVHYHRATILSKAGDKPGAAEAFKRASELAPDDADIWLSFADVMRNLDQPQAAVDMLTRAIELNPNYAAAYSNLGNILADAAMLEDAIAAHRMALKLNPNVSEIYNNLGSALQNACRTGEAVEVYLRALQLNPGSDAMYWNLALCLLAIGRLEDGWDLYGFGFASKQRVPFRPFPGLLWQGEELAGKTIMLWREQGVGDDLRFSTCIDDIAEEAGHVIVETDHRLVSLYKRTWPNVTVRAETDRATGLSNYPEAEIDFDYTAPMGIAASMRRRHLTDFPATPRALVADPARRAEARAWLDSLGAGPKIGLTWRSGLRTPIRDLFATRIADWAPLVERGAILVNLQFGKPEEEIREAAEQHGLIIHQMPGLDTHNDLDGVAALTAELDSSTGLWNAATEMVGALGKRASIYMHANHSMQLGTGTLPWRPNLKIHTVMPGFERAPVIARIVDEVFAELSAREKI